MIQEYVINNNYLVLPMFTLVLLTFSVLVRLFRIRNKLARERVIHPSFFKVYQGGEEPEQSAKLARHFANLCEAPVLFYTVCLAAMVIDVTGMLFMGLAWLYVVARCVHTIIHTGSNKLYPRIYAYFSSWTILLALWALLVFQIVVTPS